MALVVLFKERESNINIWAVVLLVSAVVLSGCSSFSSSNTEEENSKTLIRIAQKFNDDYRIGNFGSVYDRWNARSRAIITRADYIRRHVECPNNPQSSVHVLEASHGTGHQWVVRYSIDDSKFVDSWFYLQGRWEFDLVTSNPDAVKLYELPFAGYALKLGCISS